MRYYNLYKISKAYTRKQDQKIKILYRICKPLKRLYLVEKYIRNQPDLGWKEISRFINKLDAQDFVKKLEQIVPYKGE